MDATAPGGGPTAPLAPPAPGEPAAFTAAVEAVRATALRPEIGRQESPGPAGLAPWTLAVAGEVVDETGGRAADGRFVLLHDPAGQPGWEGRWRVVVQVRCSPADRDADDPRLAEVAWGWLVAALGGHGLPLGSLGGTVTRSASRSFGALRARGAQAELQVRASFSPTHRDPASAAQDALLAWAQVLGSAAGLPPPSPGPTRPPAHR